MAEPKPLFVMGNKRSGTTLTVQLINSHPRIWQTHEADLIWLLHQLDRDPGAKIVPHRFDSSMMLSSTDRRYGRFIRKSLGKSPAPEDYRRVFFEVEDRMMRRFLDRRHSLAGRMWFKAKKVGKHFTDLQRIKRVWGLEPDRMIKEDLAWSGDKKHAQHLDPEVRAFMTKVFPDARYVHVVRDPRGVVASMDKANRDWWVMPDYFRDGPEAIVAQWAVHEDWVLQAKENEGSEILTIRLEDLAAEPHETLERIFSFLDLEMHPEVERRIPLLVHTSDPNRKHRGIPLPANDRAREIMALYGYEV